MDKSTVCEGKITFGELFAKLKEIQACLQQSLDELHRKLEFLDSRPGLQNSLLDLKVIAQIRANELEAEVKKLREDLLNFSDLLGIKVEKTTLENVDSE
jgi:hypothetical protein